MQKSPYIKGVSKLNEHSQGNTQKLMLTKLGKRWDTDNTDMYNKIMILLFYLTCPISD